MPAVEGRDYYEVTVKWRQFLKAVMEYDDFQGTSREEVALANLNKAIDALKRMNEWPMQRKGDESRTKRACIKVSSLVRQRNPVALR